MGIYYSNYSLLTSKLILGHFTLIAHTSAPGDGTGNAASTSGTPIDTTLADFIIIAVSPISFVTGPPVIVDTYGNTWFPLTQSPGGFDSVQLFYAKSIIGGVGHVFTSTLSGAYQAICVAAFSGANLTVPYSSDHHTNESSNASSMPAGNIPIIPPQDNCLVVVGMGDWNNSSLVPTIDLGYTVLERQPYNPAACIGCTLAYRIQTLATIENPTWTLTPSSPTASSSIACFKT